MKLNRVIGESAVASAVVVLAVAIPATGSVSGICKRPSSEAKAFKASKSAVVYRESIKEPDYERFDVYYGCVKSVGKTKVFWDEQKELASAGRVELHGASVTFHATNSRHSRCVFRRIDLRTGQRKIIRTLNRPC